MEQPSTIEQRLDQMQDAMVAHLKVLYESIASLQRGQLILAGIDEDEARRLTAWATPPAAEG